MPLQVMDASKIEDKGKDKGKLQDGCKEKSILDFFKTPEKEVTSKQKSLLQFFVKTSSSKTNNGEVKDGTNDVNKENKTGVKEKSLVTEEQNVNKKGRKKQVKRKLDTEKKSKVKKHDKDEIQGKDVVNEDCSDNSLIIIDTEETSRVEENSVGKTKGQETNDEHSKDSSCKNTKNENEINPSVNTKKLRDQEIIEDKKQGTKTVDDDFQTNSQMAKIQSSEIETKSETDSVGQKTAKRNNLKVQDMLNLLNEVQVIEKKEKKKKHKHKLHKHKSKDVIEVNGIDCDNTEETDNQKQTNFDSADKVDELTKVSEGIDKNKTDNGQSEKAGKETELKLNCDNVKEETKLSKNKLIKSHKTEKEGKEQKNKQKDEEIQNTNELDSRNSNEMSYTDFLAKLNSSQTEEEMDVEEQEDEIENNSEKIDNEEQGNENDGKLVKEESNNMITKFFSYTSTPGKDSVPVKKQKKKECAKDITGEKKGTKINTEEKGLESDSVDKVNFLQSKPSVSSKNSSQATLSFGVDGFKMTKQKDDSNSKSDIIGKKSVKNGEIKEKTSIPEKDTNKADLNTSESVFATPVSKKTRKRKVASYLELSTDLDESDLADRSELDGCRRSSRKKYKVTVFQMDEERKTPIKIKLRRCAKSSSSANEDLEKSSEGKQLQKRKEKIKNNIKQTKAQALLEKAKNRIHGTKLLKSKKNKTKQTDKQIDKTKKEKGKKKKDKSEKEHKTDESDSDKSIARRSSRLEGKVRISMEDVSFDNIVILSDEDETEKSSKPGRKKKNKDVDGALKKGGLTDKAEKKGTPVKQGKLGTPAKQGKGKSPVKKSGVKLAPMFMIGKKKSADSPVKPALDPEQAKQRQLFLMSGVPDELKKQTVIRQANTLASSYPPIPTINHVQQVPKDHNNDDGQTKKIDVWKLQSVSLNLRDVVNNGSPVPQCNVGTLSTSIHKPGNIQTDQIKLKKAVEKFDEATIDRCVNEISVSNPSYRVQEMYKAMKESKIQADADHNKTKTQELRTDMKGILSETVDLEPNKKKRPSLKLNKKDSMEVQGQDTKGSGESNQTVSGGSSLLWTDKYYPMKASEILGNSASLKKLKDWLLEWKQVLDREARKARKLLMKKNKGKLPSSKGTAWDEDSDFDLDSEDSEDDMSLCNTTLLVGPHGCGKTSSVYALAQELGFKVHEVNASSSRTGRQILSQLQEATQSHQVSSQGCHTPSKKKGHIEKPSEEAGPPPKSKMALAFTNLLNKQSTNDKDKNEATEKKKKRGRPKKGVEEAPAEVKKDPSVNSIKNKKMAALISEESNSQSFANSINLSATTLILFEEVDVSFEEDKGFLQAVQTFMSSTKIPIILTSNERHFSQSFDGRVEVINMKRPSVTSLTSHLQTIALTENIRTDFLKMSELVRLNDRDVRQCILTLQYLVSSGGTLDQSHKVLDDVTKKTEITKHAGDQTVDDMSNSGTIDKSDDDLDDFVVIKGRQNKRRRIVEDLDSNSGDSIGNRLTNTGVVERRGDLAEARKFPSVYGLGLKSILRGLAHCQKQSNTDCLIEILKECSGSSTLIDIYQTFYSITRSSLFYNNLHLLLPLSYTIFDNIRQISMKDDCNKKKGKKRKRIQCDLYDSEGSDTETPAVSDINKDSTIVDSEETSKPEEEDSGKDKTSGTNNACISRSLCSFASFYDTMSTLDVLRTSCDVKNRDRICVKSSVKSQTHLPPGLEDELCNFRSISDIDIESANVLHSCIETRAFCKLFKSTCDVKDEMEKCEDMDSHLTESFTLPITPGMEELQLSESGTRCASTEQQRVVTDIRDNLPYTVHRNTRCIHTDYIPTLREICRGESLRLTANTKRRFHHYLDSITLPLRDKTMAVLTSTFT